MPGVDRARLESLLEDRPPLHDFAGDGNLKPGGVTPAMSARLAHDISAMDAPAVLETGAGFSTLLFCCLGASKVTSIAPDAALWDRIRAEAERRSIDTSVLHEVCARSDEALPPLAAAGEAVDVAFLDGDHGWPSVFVDFCYINMMMRRGGRFYIDDLQLYPPNQLALWLRQQPGYVWEGAVEKMAVVRKDTDERHLPHATKQPFVVANSLLGSGEIWN